jgi:putative protease
LSSTNSTLNLSGIEKRFKGLNNSLFDIKLIDIKELQEGLFIPFKELTEIKDQILFILNDGVKNIAPIIAPKLLKPITENENGQKIKPSISVLISSEADIPLSQSSTAEIYYKLPEHIANQYEKLVEMFLANEQLTPWFPSILIGDDLKKAIDLIKRVKPKKIVSDNTGVGFAAYKNNIDWIAGPHLNITNSFSSL